VPLAFGLSSKRLRLQAMSPAQSGNAAAANAMRLPSGEGTKPSTSSAKSVSCTGSPPPAGMA
jgi:hypothetical protein